MTNELAIRILTGDVLGTSEQTHEAIKMAVKALSQPDVADINVGDTVYRQAAKGNIEEILEYLDTVVHPLLSPEHWNVYSELHDMISCLSSTKPEILRCKDCEHYREEKDWHVCDMKVSWCSENQSCGFAK